ncbi:unnamed protein product [Eruca vesicaria subsp. sativa]|uniref:Uncharacterized protein n=1 Tax=Eruca vesicaria subsp. sativa TaxID=29727 RepID=A0ABC8K7L8_ERUVS|nr:unnamed protein product [Eruca vesicaria subsp. sativa]
MEEFVKLIQGIWEKTPSGEWVFDENPIADHEIVLINSNDSFDNLVEMIRIRLDLGVLTPVVLTYQIPDPMVSAVGPLNQPTTLSTDKDVEDMLSLMEFMTGKELYVTSGPELVAKYQFHCRTPFKIGNQTFLGEGVTEDQHHQAIRDIVGREPVVCNNNILEIMFNEPQLLIVHRVALEIELVYAPTPEEMAAYPRLTMDDVITIQEGDTVRNDEQINNGQIGEVLQGEPMDEEQLTQAFPNGIPPNVENSDTTLEIPPLREIPPIHTIWEEDSVGEEAYWDRDQQINVQSAPRPTTGSLGLPIGPNLRVSAAPTPNTVLLVEEDEASFTNSSENVNEIENQMGPMGDNGDLNDQMPNGTAPLMPQITPDGPAAALSSNGGPSLNLTLGLGIMNNNGSEPIINITDTDSEADGDSGGFGFDPNF